MFQQSTLKLLAAEQALQQVQDHNVKKKRRIEEISEMSDKPASMLFWQNQIAK